MMMCVVCVCAKKEALCKYTLRNSDFFLSWTRVRLVRQKSVSSELVMCGSAGCCMLLLPLVAICL